MRAKGEAEADALARRADAFRQFNEAAIIQTVLAELPKIVAAAAQPLGQIDNLTILSADGATDLVKTGTRTVLEASTAVKGLTGIDIPALLGDRLGTGDGDRWGGRAGVDRPMTSPSSPTPSAPAQPAEDPSATDIAAAETIRAAGEVLRQVPGVDAFREVPLSELATRAPERYRDSIARAFQQLPPRFGEMTVGEVLDRTAR